MTAPTINGSTYPQPVDDLLPEARKLTQELAELPSRNRLMREFRIGPQKANALLSHLTDERARQEQADTLHTAMVVRGSFADRPVLIPTDPTPDADTTDTDPGTSPDESQPAPDTTPTQPAPADERKEQPAPVESPDTNITDPPARPSRAVVVWPVVLLALPAFVAVWSGWVGLGQMCGFGQVDLLPGFTGDNGEPVATLNTAITLPIGMETYGTYALYVWLSGRLPRRARRFAMWSAITSLGVGAAGQIVYHLLAAADITKAPWPITAAVACLPVAVLGMGAALAHLVRENAR
ncbi:ABC transporter permease [Salinispora arenicola]|uniref:ABC transporter permease n=1 Tax=Salinispora arenicola TaxID=168697 RepID=UPI0016AA1605|nr:ABC transporter permease [Salinispora arenicola]NIL56224.1 ABC transporter permease [Salinispora arenicola]NIL62145.1 ABC transporter permease [Salinispora arenicola]